MEILLFHFTADTQSVEHGRRTDCADWCRHVLHDRRGLPESPCLAVQAPHHFSGARLLTSSEPEQRQVLYLCRLMRGEKGKGKNQGQKWQCWFCDQLGHMNKHCQKRNSDMASAQNDGRPLVDMRQRGSTAALTAPSSAVSDVNLFITSNVVLVAPIILQVDEEPIIEKERFVCAITRRKVENVPGVWLKFCITVMNLYVKSEGAALALAHVSAYSMEVQEQILLIDCSDDMPVLARSTHTCVARKRDDDGWRCITTLGLMDVQYVHGRHCVPHGGSWSCCALRESTASWSSHTVVEWSRAETPSGHRTGTLRRTTRNLTLSAHRTENPSPPHIATTDHFQSGHAEHFTCFQTRTWLVALWCTSFIGTGVGSVSQAEHPTGHTNKLFEMRTKSRWFR